MAFRRPNSKKSTGLVSSIKPLALGVAGGFVGSQLTGLLEKQSFMNGKETFAPAVTLVAGFVLSNYLSDSMKNIASGMAIVAGTELLESLIASQSGTPAGAQTIKGVTPMGYVPDLEVTGADGYNTYGGGSVN